MIEKTFRHLTKEKQQRAKGKLYADPLFKMIFLPLWYQRNNDLSPVEVWQEAMMVIDELREIESDIRHVEVSEIVEQLVERYSSFDEYQREPEMAQHSMMMVMAVVMFMLAEADADWKHNPHYLLCQSIGQILSHVKGFKQLCNDVKTEEKRLVEQKTPLPIRDFMKRKAMEIDLSRLRSFTDEEVASCGISSNRPLKVLQAIDKMVPLLENDNDWIAIYAVLVEREYILRTMTTFCTMVNRLFSASINSRYMNGVLKSHGESTDKWKEVYDDQKRHLELAAKFRNTLMALERT
ncbi:MAG: hypothetical protein ACI3Y0_04835 [Prevotella sp.]